MPDVFAPPDDMPEPKAELHRSSKPPPPPAALELAGLALLAEDAAPPIEGCSDAGVEGLTGPPNMPAGMPARPGEVIPLSVNEDMLLACAGRVGGDAADELARPGESAPAVMPGRDDEEDAVADG